MAERVYGEQTPSAVTQELANLFQDARYTGTLYIGYPVLATVEGVLKIDALYVDRYSGVVAFDTNHLTITEDNTTLVQDVTKFQDRLYAALNSKLLETPELLERRKLLVPITIITLSTHQTFRAGEVVVSTLENIKSQLPRDTEIPYEKFRVLNSVIERTATIKPQKRRSNVANQNSLGGALRQIERSIANLDAWQKRAAIEMPAGPQRIRGLAGSGKTIVLALKAAFLHSREPDWRIVVTFQTRSLYQQFRRLTRQFCYEFSKQEPDWDRLTVIHAWGSSAYKGVYSEIAQQLGQPVSDFSSAKERYGASNAFGGLCRELLAAVSDNGKPDPIYDAVLIDEGQDLPQPFFELVYLFTKNPKRIVYAYDELQNLSDFAMVSAEQLFGKKKNGQANVHLRNEAGKPRSDIILPVCYRNTPWALTTAHGLGFGTARGGGLIQMFDEPNLWQEIGYEVVSGDLAQGQQVGLRRSQEATAPFFENLLTADDTVKFCQFPNTAAELNWLSEAIEKNLSADELDYDDILVVVPEAITIRATAASVMRALRERKIKTHLVGVTATQDAIFSADSIAITSIYRAKGNEAPMVYVIGADYCYGGFNIARKRNILFTAITRSRAWVRVSGVGDRMGTLIHEYQTIRGSEFQLRFQYPTADQLQEIRTLHRDRSSDELEEIEKDLEGLTRLVRRVREGEISLDALPLEAQALIRQLWNESPRPRATRRAPN